MERMPLPHADLLLYLFIPLLWRIKMNANEGEMERSEKVVVTTFLIKINSKSRNSFLRFDHYLVVEILPKVAMRKF